MHDGWDSDFGALDAAILSHVNVKAINGFPKCGGRFAEGPVLGSPILVRYGSEVYLPESPAWANIQRTHAKVAAAEAQGSCRVFQLLSQHFMTLIQLYHTVGTWHKTCHGPVSYKPVEATHKPAFMFGIYTTQRAN